MHRAHLHHPSRRPRSLIGAAALALVLAIAVPGAALAADPTLKGAYGFEEGSGNTVADASSTGNAGAITGAAWTTSGRFGNALSFDGIDDLVTVPDSDSLDFATAMTLEAWVRPTALGGYRSAIMKEAASALVYALYPETSRAQPTFQVQMGGRLRGVNGPTQLPVNTWSHLAATFDGNLFRLYVNGTEVAIGSRRELVTTSTGPLRIGGTLIYPEFFKGDIDEVRLYNRALTAGEVQTDMNTQVAAGVDTTPPSPPTNFIKTGASPTSISSSWTASVDDRGVDAYHMFVNGQPAGTTTLTTFNFTGLTCGTAYTLGVEAWDVAQNKSSRTTLSNATTGACDSQPPTVSMTSPTAGATVSSTISVAANASDNDQVAGVQFLLDDQPLGDEDTTAPYSAPWNTRSATNGQHVVKARARDRAGLTTTSAGVTVTVENTTAEPPPGLVAGYGFDEGSGGVVEDASGTGNDGAITGATWTAGGRIGAALDFDGVDDGVTVPDSDSLDLTSAMTVSAWVRPDTLNGAWRTVIFKQRTGNHVFALYAQAGSPVSQGEITIGSSVLGVSGTGQLPLGAWSHLTMTYDGTAQRIFVNGTQVASIPRSGAILTSTGTLTIGSNPVWGERFDGLIDEVRVYNRALGQGEIQADMDTSVGTPDSTPPSAPTSLAATGAVGRVTLTWTASTDDVGVANYNVHRSTTANFTPTTANRVGQPTTAAYTDSGLAPGTYFYKVTAEDRAHNVSTASNQATGTATADTVLPNVSVTAPANGATVAGTVTVNATASDNESVAGVQFRLDGQNLGTEDTSAPYAIAWNSRLVANGPHVLSARARDGSGNTRTSTDVNVTVDNTFTPPPGLVAGYGFDEASGSTVEDASSNNNLGTISGAARVPIGRFGRAIDFDGTNDYVEVPDSNSLDATTGLTMSAWVKADVMGTPWRTVLFKARTGNNVYAIYGNTNAQVPNGELTLGSTLFTLNGTSKVPDGAWTHLTVTYDGANVRLYMNGTQVASFARTGSIQTSNLPLRIGGNAIWGEYWDGLIDEVRIYDRGLSAAEVQADMSLSVARDTTAPTVTEVAPANGTNDEGVGPTVTATFSEAMDPSSITTATFALRDPQNVVVPATVTYDDTTGKATLRPSAALRYGTQYTATVEGGTVGNRAKDMSGNALATDRVWSFTTEQAPPPILVLTSPTNPYSTFVTEIMRAEGVNGFYRADVSLVDAAFLSNFSVVVLGDIAVTPAQASAFSSWVTGGGNLIALKPDSDLAGLLGITSAASTLTDAYLRVNTASAPGAGIVSDSMQFHGTADRYTLSGASAVATLWSNATTATGNPAVTMRSVGGGQAAAFTYDLARSVVLTRQGNPAWAGQNRDGLAPARTNDMFYGGTEPNWVDLNKIHIPQADEQQRLLANMITDMSRDKAPVPRFWYLPRGEKAAVVMTGDDHADGGTAGRFNHYKAASPPGCSVAEWDCVRSTSYLYAPSPISNSQVAGFEAEGFEVALHPTTGGCGNPTFAQYTSLYTNQLAEFAAAYPAAPAPLTSRFHCVAWSDWSSHAKVQVDHGIRMDTNYYHYPPAWGGFPGYMTGSGEIMRFADLDGSTIDIYQAHTHIDDEAMDTGAKTATAINSLLDWATGPQGYYGLFTMNMHTDDVDSDGSDAILASAQARDVPIVSARQALRWVEGRDGSRFKSFTWGAGNLGFTVTAGSGANGLRGMLPVQSSVGTLTSLTRNGTPVSLTAQTVKGVQYGFFSATDGQYVAHYG